MSTYLEVFTYDLKGSILLNRVLQAYTSLFLGGESEFCISVE